jgi:hypothetical protein
MSDVYLAITFQALCRMASGVERKLLSAAAQESNAAPVSDANKQAQIHRESFGTGQDSATTAVFITQFDSVRSASDDLAQFFTLDQHVRE